MPSRLLRLPRFVLALVAICLPAASAQNLSRTKPRPLAWRNQPSNAPTRLSPGDWQQLVKLVSGRGSATEYFGQSVGISGETIVVSSQTNYVNAMAGFVFVEGAGGWSNLPVAGLRLSSPVDRFETIAAIDGDTIVIGCPSYDPGTPSYAYIFVKPSTGWKDMTPTAVLAPSDTTDGYFASSVSIQGDTIVLGDPGYDSSSGAVYVYTKPATGWRDMTQTAKLTASDGVLDDALGDSVSLYGSTIAAGAPQFIESGPSGKAYVFVQPPSGWTNMTQTAELTVPNAPGGSDIGSSVYLSDSWALVGAPSFDNGGFGAAYVFLKPSSGWTNITASATLTAADQRPYSQFGSSVSGNGNFAVVGSPRRGAPPFGDEGGIYVYEEPASGWQNMSGSTLLTGSDARDANYVGDSVAMSGSIVVAGAENFYTPGAAYVFGLQ